MSALHRSRLVLGRVGLAVGAFLALGGPSPGHVGGCGGDSADNADPDAFCHSKLGLECSRRVARGEFATTEAYQAACGAAAIDSACVPYASCSLTQTDAQACLDALSATDVSVVVVPACSNLCGGI